MTLCQFWIQTIRWLRIPCSQSPVPLCKKFDYVPRERPLRESPGGPLRPGERPSQPSASQPCHPRSSIYFSLFLLPPPIPPVPTLSLDLAVSVELPQSIPRGTERSPLSPPKLKSREIHGGHSCGFKSLSFGVVHYRAKITEILPKWDKLYIKFCVLQRHLSNFGVCINLRILVKFCPGRSGWGLRFCISKSSQMMLMFWSVGHILSNKGESREDQPFQD